MDMDCDASEVVKTLDDLLSIVEGGLSDNLKRTPPTKTVNAFSEQKHQESKLPNSSIVKTSSKDATVEVAQFLIDLSNEKDPIDSMKRVNKTKVPPAISDNSNSSVKTILSSITNSVQNLVDFNVDSLLPGDKPNMLLKDNNDADTLSLSSTISTLKRIPATTSISCVSTTDASNSCIAADLKESKPTHLSAVVKMPKNLPKETENKTTINNVSGNSVSSNLGESKTNFPADSEMPIADDLPNKAENGINYNKLSRRLGSSSKFSVDDIAMKLQSSTAISTSSKPTSTVQQPTSTTQQPPSQPAEDVSKKEQMPDLSSFLRKEMMKILPDMLQELYPSNKSDSLTSDDSSEPAQSVLELPNVDILPPFTTAFTSTVMSNPTQTLIKISKVSNTNPSSSLLSSYLMKKVIHIKEQLSNSSPKDQFHVTQNMINSECTFSSPPLGITQNMNQSQNQQQKYYTAEYTNKQTGSPSSHPSLKMVPVQVPPEFTLVPVSEYIAMQQNDGYNSNLQIQTETETDPQMSLKVQQSLKQFKPIQPQPFPTVNFKKPMGYSKPKDADAIVSDVMKSCYSRQINRFLPKKQHKTVEIEKQKPAEVEKQKEPIKELVTQPVKQLGFSTFPIVNPNDKTEQYFVNTRAHIERIDSFEMINGIRFYKVKRTFYSFEEESDAHLRYIENAPDHLKMKAEKSTQTIARQTRNSLKTADEYCDFKLIDLDHCLSRKRKNSGEINNGKDSSKKKLIKLQKPEGPIFLPDGIKRQKQFKLGLEVKPTFLKVDAKEKVSVSQPCKEFDFAGTLSKAKVSSKLAQQHGIEKRCKHCQKTFYGSIKFKAHQGQYSKYKCPRCSVQICNHKTLYKHIKTHLKYKHQCFKCLKEFDSLEDFKKHQMSAHPKQLKKLLASLEKTDDSSRKVWSCVLCQKTFKTFMSVCKHRTKLCKKRNDQGCCNICNKMFSDPSKLMSHIRLHNLNLQREHTTKKGNLLSSKLITRKYLKWVKRKKEQQCTRCDSGFTHCELFYKHIDQGQCKYLNKSNLACMMCRRVCESMLKLKEHVGSCFREALTSLLIPGKKKPSMTSESERDEPARKIHHCNKCTRRGIGKMFPTKAIFQRHKTVYHHKNWSKHPKNSFLKCNKCYFQCQSEGLLKKHLKERKCLKMDDYQCYMCSSNVKKYQQTQQQQRPTIIFKSVSCLLRHLRSHNNDKNKLTLPPNVIPAEIQTNDGKTKLLTYNLHGAKCLVGNYQCIQHFSPLYIVTVVKEKNDYKVKAVRYSDVLPAFELEDQTTVDTLKAGRNYEETTSTSTPDTIDEEMEVDNGSHSEVREKASIPTTTEIPVGEETAIESHLIGDSEIVGVENVAEMKVKFYLWCCNVCDKVYETRSKLVSHTLSSKHKDSHLEYFDDWTCCFCLKTCRQPFQHAERHTDIMFECYICYVRKTSVAGMEAHFENKHFGMNDTDQAFYNQLRAKAVSKTVQVMYKNRDTKEKVLLEEGTTVDKGSICKRCNLSFMFLETMIRHQEKGICKKWVDTKPGDSLKSPPSSSKKTKDDPKASTSKRRPTRTAAAIAASRTQRSPKESEKKISQTPKKSIDKNVTGSSSTETGDLTTKSTETSLDATKGKEIAYDTNSFQEDVDPNQRGPKMFFKCPVCHCLATEFKKMERHLATKHAASRCILEDEPVVVTVKQELIKRCDFCHLTYAEDRASLLCQLAHVGVETETCNICLETFQTQTALLHHVLGRHKSMFCPLCHKGFHTYEGMVTHCQLHVHEMLIPRDANGKMVIEIGIHNGKQFLFPDQHESFAERFCISSKIPPAVIADSRLFYCILCQQNIEGELTHIVHMKTHESKRPLSCLRCQARFVTADDLRRHFELTKHTGTTKATYDQRAVAQPKFVCFVCFLVFEDNKALHKHQSEHLPNDNQYNLRKSLKVMNTLQCYLRQMPNVVIEQKNNIDWSLDLEKANQKFGLPRIIADILTSRQVPAKHCRTTHAWNCCKQSSGITYNFNCHVCLTPLKCSLEKHVMSKHLDTHQETKIRCCHSLFNTQAQLLQHVAQNHLRHGGATRRDSIIYCCPYCIIMCDLDHLQRHHAGLSFVTDKIRCSYCSLIFHKKDFRLHLADTNPMANVNKKCGCATQQMVVNLVTPTKNPGDVDPTDTPEFHAHMKEMQRKKLSQVDELAIPQKPEDEPKEEEEGLALRKLIQLVKDDDFTSKIPGTSRFTLNESLVVARDGKQSSPSKAVITTPVATIETTNVNNFRPTISEMAKRRVVNKPKANNDNNKEALSLVPDDEYVSNIPGTSKFTLEDNKKKRKWKSSKKQATAAASKLQKDDPNILGNVILKTSEEVFTKAKQKKINQAEKLIAKYSKSQINSRKNATTNSRKSFLTNNKSKKKVLVKALVSEENASKSKSVDYLDGNLNSATKKDTSFSTSAQTPKSQPNNTPSKKGNPTDNKRGSKPTLIQQDITEKKPAEKKRGSKPTLVQQDITEKKPAPGKLTSVSTPNKTPVTKTNTKTPVLANKEIKSVLIPQKSSAGKSNKRGRPPKKRTEVSTQEPLSLSESPLPSPLKSTNKGKQSNKKKEAEEKTSAPPHKLSKSPVKASSYTTKQKSVNTTVGIPPTTTTTLQKSPVINKCRVYQNLLSESPETCPLCTWNFQTYDELKEHLMHHKLTTAGENDDNPVILKVSCLLCDRILVTNKLNSHILLTHNKEVNSQRRRRKVENETTKRFSFSQSVNMMMDAEYPCMFCSYIDQTPTPSSNKNGESSSITQSNATSTMKCYSLGAYLRHFSQHHSNLLEHEIVKFRVNSNPQIVTELTEYLEEAEAAKATTNNIKNTSSSTKRKKATWEIGLPPPTTMPYPHHCIVCGKGFYRKKPSVIHLKNAHPWFDENNPVLVAKFTSQNTMPAFVNVEKLPVPSSSSSPLSPLSGATSGNFGTQSTAVASNETSEDENKKVKKGTTKKSDVASANGVDKTNNLKTKIENILAAKEKKKTTNTKSGNQMNRKIIRPGRPPSAFKKSPQQKRNQTKQTEGVATNDDRQVMDSASNSNVASDAEDGIEVEDSGGIHIEIVGVEEEKKIAPEDLQIADNEDDDVSESSSTSSGEGEVEEETEEEILESSSDDENDNDGDDSKKGHNKNKGARAETKLKTDTLELKTGSESVELSSEPPPSESLPSMKTLPAPSSKKVKSNQTNDASKVVRSDKDVENKLKTQVSEDGKLADKTEPQGSVKDPKTKDDISAEQDKTVEETSDTVDTETISTCIDDCAKSRERNKSDEKLDAKPKDSIPKDEAPIESIGNEKEETEKVNDVQTVVNNTADSTTQDSTKNETEVKKNSTVKDSVMQKPATDSPESVVQEGHGNDLNTKQVSGESVGVTPTTMKEDEDSKAILGATKAVKGKPKGKPKMRDPLGLLGENVSLDPHAVLVGLDQDIPLLSPNNDQIGDKSVAVTPNASIRVRSDSESFYSTEGKKFVYSASIPLGTPSDPSEGVARASGGGGGHFYNNYPLVCLFCGQGFYSRSKLKIHLTSKHANNYTSELEKCNSFVNLDYPDVGTFTGDMPGATGSEETPKPRRRSRAKFEEVMRSLKPVPRVIPKLNPIRKFPPKSGATSSTSTPTTAKPQSVAGKKRKSAATSSVKAKPLSPKRKKGKAASALVKKITISTKQKRRKEVSSSENSSPSKKKRGKKVTDTDEDDSVAEESSESESGSGSDSTEPNAFIKNPNKDDGETSDSDDEEQVNAKHKHRCVWCDQMFVDKDTMKAHVKRHFKGSKLNRLTCDACFCLVERHLLRRHMHQEHNDMPLSQKRVWCEHCTYSVKRSGAKKHFEKHIFEKHPSLLKIECRICDARFLTTALYNGHFQATHGKSLDEQSMECLFCNKKFSTLNKLYCHFSVVHMKKNKDFYCSLCSKYFYGRTDLDSHQEEFHKNDNYQCGLCLVDFDSVASCESHVMVHKQKSDFQCVTCKFFFDSSITLANHKTTHQDEEQEVGSNSRNEQDDENTKEKNNNIATN